MTHETLDTNAQDQVRSICERAEFLNDQIKALQKDKTELFKEAKGNGYDVPALKACIKLRAMPDVDRETQESILDVYRHATGCE